MFPVIIIEILGGFLGRVYALTHQVVYDYFKFREVFVHRSGIRGVGGDRNGACRIDKKQKYEEGYRVEVEFAAEVSIFLTRSTTAHNLCTQQTACIVGEQCGTTEPTKKVKKNLKLTKVQESHESHIKGYARLKYQNNAVSLFDFLNLF